MVARGLCLRAVSLVIRHGASLSRSLSCYNGASVSLRSQRLRSVRCYLVLG